MKLSKKAVVITKRHNKVVYRDGDKLVKVFNGEKPAADVFNEALNTTRVEGIGISVPEVLKVDRIKGGEHDGSWALAHRYVSGKTMYDLWTQGDETETGQLIERFVDLQLRVLSHTAPLLNRQKDKLQRMISATNGIIDATTRYDLHMRVDGMRKANAVCHGDFNPSNVIVEKTTGELYVCDWAHVTVGLPEVDAAMTYLLFNVEYPQFAERYIDAFCKQADIARQVVNYWLPVVAAAELSRGRKKSEDFLKSWVNVYDYE